MNGKWVKASACAALALALFGIQAPDNAKAAEGDFELTVLHTNDTHASLKDAPKRATLVKQVRADKENTLLLDAGDVFSGTLYFNAFAGQADLEMMNYMGYDAMTFGNHEFDLGASEEGHQALADFITGAEFPLVSANVDFSNDEKFEGLQNLAYTAEYENGKIYNGIVKEVEGEKVGIFGLTTEETPTISSTGDIEFSDYAEAAEEAVAAFEEQGVNKIIALTHIGYDDSLAWDNDLELAKVVEGIDIIVGGHTHTALAEPTVVEGGEEPTVIVQTGGNNSSLGQLNVTFDETGKVTSHDGELLSYDEVEPDQEAAEILAPYTAKVEELSKESIGVSTEVALNGEREFVRTGETNLGNLITDGMVATAQTINPDVTMAVTNGGGIRASIDKGDITLGEVQTVMPFGNALAIMELTGAEIREALETSVSAYPTASGGFLHVSGLKFTFDPQAEAGARVRDILAETADGFAPIDEEATYFVASNTFTAKGGDGYEVFKAAYEDGRVSEPGNVDYQMFIDYLTSFESINLDLEGRILTAHPFTDLDSDNEFTPFIQNVYNVGIVKGTTPTTYSPNKILSRTQAVSMIVRALGLETEGKTSSFKDLGNMKEETKAEVAAAEEAGIVIGSNGNFMPNEQVKRAQLALMLKRVYELQKKTKYDGDATDLPFKDISGSDEETVDAIAFLYEQNIADGSENGTKFRPLEGTSRAQAAKIYSNFLNVIK